LLRRFLPYAACVDVELRSAASLRSVLAAAQDAKIKRIISVHDLQRTPDVVRLEQWMRSAEALSADVFKVATLTDTTLELARLVEFFEKNKAQIPISAMGMGRLGRASRTLLARRGSVLNYAHLGTPQTEGQFSLTEARRALLPSRRAS
jgi:3-dehydroquinate dehydratase-1